MRGKPLGCLLIIKLKSHIHMHHIYLDYAATTPVVDQVVNRMLEYLTIDRTFGNPSSLHSYGREALKAVEAARDQVALCLNAEAKELIWTSGATESINLAIKGAAQLYQRKGKHIVTLQNEHKAVLDACQYLEKLGYQVSYLAPQKNGLVDLAELEETLRSDTVLVSIMQVNNETGIVQDIAAIAELTYSRGILLHVDAAQAIGKIDIDLQKVPVDLMSLCAHKVYGPKGIGALFLRKKPRVRVAALLHGGGHEQGMRSGTLATHQIVGMGEACEIAKHALTKDRQIINALRDQFLNGLKTLKNFQLNAPLTHTVPHILNVRFEGMLAEALLAQLPMIAASTASACKGNSIEGSHVLRAMGFNPSQIKSSIRFSFGRFTTSFDIETVVKVIKNLMSVSPVRSGF